MQVTSHSTAYKEYSWLHCFFLVVCFIPFLYAMCFLFPAGDDLGRAYKAQYLFDIPGALHELGRAWWKWSGRYTHHFMIIFFGDLAENQLGYAIACIGNVLITVLSLSGISKELGHLRKYSTALFWGLLLTLAIMCTHTALDTTWFLLTDVLGLGAACSFTLTYIWSLCRLWNAPCLTKGNKFFCIASGIAAIGCYEYSALMVPMISVTVWYMARVYKHKHQHFFLVLLVLSVTFLLLSFLARGNFRRQAKQEVPAEVIQAQLVSIWQDWRTYIAPALITPAWLGIVAWVSLLPKRQSTPLTQQIPLWAILCYCVLASIGFMGVMTVIHAMTNVPISSVNKIPPNMAFFVSIIVAFFFFCLQQTKTFSLFARLPRGLIICTALVPLLLSSNMQQVIWLAISGTAQEYAATKKRQIAFYAKHPQEHLVVPPIDICPYPVCWTDPVTPVAKAWPTKYVAKLYNLASIKAVPVSAKEAYAAASDIYWQPVKSGTAAAYIPRLTGGPNACYEYDWIFLSLKNTTPLTKQFVVVTIHTDSLLEKLKLPAVIQKPNWVHIAPGLRHYNLNAPEYHIISGMHETVVGVPVHIPGSSSVSCFYISFDGITFYQLPTRSA